MFVCDKIHDEQPIPVVMVARSGTILCMALGPDQIVVRESEHIANADTGVPVAHRLSYEVDDGDTSYAIAFEHREDGFMLDFSARPPRGH